MATRVFEKPVSRDMLDLQRSIAITANGNTHAAISTGQFVYVKNHSTLTDGLYVATDDIVEDGTLSSSNLTADTSGGLNALQAQIDDITGDIGTVPSGKTLQGQINANSAHIDNLQDGLAIVSDNNTHAAIASGQFVYVKNHGTLDEGMYKATAAIAQNETLSSSNLTAVADGGLNAVKSDIPAVVNDLTSDSTTSALSAAQGKALNGNITALDRAKIVYVSTTVTIASIAANAYGSANVDVDIPDGTYGIKTIVPRYTSIGIPIAGAYGISGAASGKQRITVGVWNVTGAAVSNVTATIDVGFMY